MARKIVLKIWDARDGTYLLSRNCNERLAKAGWRSPKQAANYEKAMQETLGQGLKKRIKQAVN
jgi:hypothetical protein